MPAEVAPPTAVPVAVTIVFDGDSFAGLIDGEEQQVRLLGINATERDECWSEEARSALDDMLGESVSVDVVDTDRFGRLLGYVYTDVGLVNARMIEAGHALALSNDHDRLTTFRRSEETAFSGALGMWRRNACGRASDNSIAIARVEYDAPGPDDENLNGEWVGITNDGSQQALGGWTLRDESSIHRFTFPAGFVLSADGAVVVLTGCGADEIDQLHWCSDGSVWSNGGDTALLLDGSGNVVDRFNYTGR